MGEVPCLLAGAGDPPHPALGDPVDRMLLDGPVADREGDVATVADDVDEARLRQRPLDLPHALDVDRGLLTPAGLAGPLGIGRVEGAQGIARVERLDRAEPLEQLILVEAEVTPLTLAGDRREQRLGGRVLRLGGLDQLRDEVGLRGDRQLRVSVEHHPQQCRPGAVDPDDEGRRGALGTPRGGAAAPGLTPGFLWARKCHWQKIASPRESSAGPGRGPGYGCVRGPRARPDSRPLPGTPQSGRYGRAARRAPATVRSQRWSPREARPRRRRRPSTPGSAIRSIAAVIAAMSGRLAGIPERAVPSGWEGTSRPLTPSTHDLVHRRVVVGDRRHAEGDRLVQRQAEALPARGRDRDVVGGDRGEVLVPGLVGEPQLDPLVGLDQRQDPLEAGPLDLGLDEQPQVLAACVREGLDDRLGRLAVAEEPAGEDEPDEAVVAARGPAPRAARGGSPRGPAGSRGPSPRSAPARISVTE